jgi:deazaflavin-dependent oxidoreductase (nitroreductase family)
VGLVLIGLVVFVVVLDQLLNLLARYRRPKGLHKAARHLLGRRLNPIYLWAVDRFGIDRNSESVVIYHKGRKSGREYATPLCVSHCDEGFIVGAYWGPTADWFRNLQATPHARLRYQGEYHQVEAEVINIDEAHRRIGGPSACGCWEQGRAEQCVLLRHVPQTAERPDEAEKPTTTAARSI